MKLRTKAIIFFGMFLLVIAGVIIFYSEYIVGNALRAQSSEALRIDAEQAEGSYYTFLKILKREALDWTSVPALQNIVKSLLASKDNTADRALAEKDFTSFISLEKMPYDKSVLMADVLDKNGIVIASTRPRRIGTNEAEEEVKLKAHHFSKTIVSNFGEVFVKSIIFEVDETPEPMIHATVRFFTANPDGTHTPLDAVLLVHFLNIKEIASVLSGEVQVQDGALTGKALLSSYDTSEIYLVNSEKYMVTPSRYVTDVNQQQKVDTLPVRECLQNGKEVSGEYDDYRGIRVLGASMCLASEGLVLVVEINKSEIFTPTEILIRNTIIGALIFLVIGIFIITLFVRRPIQHIGEIVRALEKAMKGDFNTSAKVDSKDEIGIMATMFNKMLTAIRDSQDALQASKYRLEENAMILKKDIEQHEKQEKFLEGSRRATQNLLEDSWRIKESAQSEASKFQTILSSVAEGIILIDGEYKVSLVNPKAIEILELSADQILGKDVREVVTLYKKKVALSPIEWPTEGLFVTKKIVTSTLEDEYSISTKGRKNPLAISFSVAPLMGSGVSGGVIVFSDATANQELSEAKSGFISVASHQLRTPLTSIRWYSEMLLSEDAGPLNESQRDFMSEIHGGAERLYQTVDLLLGISRVESGKLKTERTPIDIGVFTSEIQKELASQAAEKHLSLSVFPPNREPIIVWLDPIMLRQVIINLLSNAIRYTNKNGNIEVKWWLDETKKEEVVYSVHDDGIGIPEEVRPRIFSKFFRAENARAFIPDGSGLGLALVKDLVESWNGKVWFEATEGKGTTFFFTVPLSTRVADIDESANMKR